MDKIVGTWHADNGQTCSYFEDGTFSAQAPLVGTLSGRYAFQNGYYILESGGSILSAFQILSYDGSLMRIGMNTGEIHTCQRAGSDQGKSASNNKDWLKPGNRVVIHGLQGSASLNGSRGVIKRFDKASSRYVIFVDQKKVEMKIREGNLKPPPAPASAARNPYMQNNASSFTNPLNPYAQMNQYTAMVDQQNAQAMQQLNQYTQMLGQQNAQAMQQLNQYTQMLDQQNANLMNLIGGGGFGGNMMNPGGFQQPQMPGFSGGGGGNKPPNKIWNAVQQGAGQVDPVATGEFVGAAAGQFVQGVGFDIGSIGISLGGLFGL
jgi:hypothetical protein